MPPPPPTPTPRLDAAARALFPGQTASFFVPADAASDDLYGAGPAAAAAAAAAAGGQAQSPSADAAAAAADEERTPTMDEPVIHSGWMRKRGRAFPWSWRRRFFILRGSRLAYYKTDSALHPSDAPGAAAAAAFAADSDGADDARSRAQTFSELLSATLSIAAGGGGGSSGVGAGADGAARKRRAPKPEAPRGTVDLSHIISVETVAAESAAAVKRRQSDLAAAGAAVADSVVAAAAATALSPSLADAERCRRFVLRAQEFPAAYSRPATPAAGAAAGSPSGGGGRLASPRAREIILEADTRGEMLVWVRVLSALAAGLPRPAADDAFA
jgi:hypothetical protein